MKKIERIIPWILILSIVVGLTGIVVMEVNEANALYEKKELCRYMEERTGEVTLPSWYLASNDRHVEVIILGNTMEKSSGALIT